MSESISNNINKEAGAFILLAPMEGVIDAPMRRVYSQLGGFDRFVCEFIRVTDKLLPDHVFTRYCPELLTGGKTPEGIPVFVQLLGGQPQFLAENAARAVQLGAPGIDLNFGCPAPTVNRHDGGATLLKNPQRLYDVISAIKAVIPPSTPVTAKVRLGFSDKSLCHDIAAAVETSGAHMLTIHARTRDEGYRPPAHWEYIAQMKAATKNTRVVANGEIWSVEDYIRCKEISGCPDVALGRGAIASPGLAKQIKAYTNGEPTINLDWQSLMENYMSPFIEMTFKYRGEKYVIARVKQWLRLLARQYKEAENLFQHVKLCHSLTEIYRLLNLPRPTFDQPLTAFSQHSSCEVRHV